MSNHRAPRTHRTLRLSVAVLASATLAVSLVVLAHNGETPTAQEPSWSSAAPANRSPHTAPVPATSLNDAPASSLPANTPDSPAPTNSPASSTTTPVPSTGTANMASRPKATPHSLKSSPSSGSAASNSAPLASPPGQTYPAPTGPLTCDPGNAPVGQWVICTGTQLLAPVIPPNNSCSGDATQCLNSLNPSDPNPVPLP